MKDLQNDGGVRLGDTIRHLIEQRLGAFFTALVGRIEEVDHEKARATVKPLMKLPAGPNRWEGLREIYEVPIDIARAGPFYVRRPYKKGDIVLLIVSSRSLERTLYNHEQQEVGFGHVNQLDDVIVVGGFRADTDELLPQKWQDDLIIQNVETKDTIVLHADGRMDVMLAGHKANYSMLVDLLESGRIRSSKGAIELDAAQKILLGLPQEYRVVLEPLVEWVAGHAHGGVEPGEGVSGPPTTPPPPQSVSQFVYARYAPPGELPFPEIEALGAKWSVNLPQIPAFVEWVSEASTGSGISLGEIAAAIGQVLGAVADAVTSLIGPFLEYMAKYTDWLVEEAVPALVDAIIAVVRDNWLELLFLLLNNPPAAVALFVKHLATNLFEGIADDAIAAFCAQLGEWLVDVGLEALGKYIASIDGLPDLRAFVNGAMSIVNQFADSGIDVIANELFRWAQREFGEDGIKAVIAFLLAAGLAAVKNAVENGELGQ